MPIKFHCPHCSAAIKAPESHAGQTLPCPKCGQPVVVAEDPAAPTPAAPTPEAPTPETPTPETPPAFPQIHEPEPIGDIPEIVTRDSRVYSTPPPAPTSAPENAFEAPQTRGDRLTDVDLQNIRIVDLHLPWKSVFKFAVQFFACNMLLAAALSIVLTIFAALLALMGIGIFA